MKKLILLLALGGMTAALIVRADFGNDGDVELISDEPGADIATQPEEFVREGERLWCAQAYRDTYGR
jgi:hypothetical protein